MHRKGKEIQRFGFIVFCVLAVFQGAAVAREEVRPLDPAPSRGDVAELEPPDPIPLAPRLHEFWKPRELTERIAAADTVRMDSVIVEAMNRFHIPGMSTCIVKDGRIVRKKSYGLADAVRGIPVTDSTIFMLASISKTFVATALMQLWEDGFLGLDDDINDYLPFPVVNPWYPQVPITARMILAHTSSIAYKAETWLPLINWGGDSPIPLGEYLASHLVPGGSRYDQSNFTAYPPGTGGEYSNVAYALAGYLVEQITGQSFEEYCQEFIFGPLGMNETSWFLSGLDPGHVAVPARWSAVRYYNYGHFGFPVYPAGQLRTSAPQLARHLIAFMQMGEIDGVRILASETVRMMRTVQYPEAPVLEGVEWGLGWYRVSTGSSWLWGHDGGIYGVSTLMYFDPQANIGVINLTNASGNVGHAIIAQELFEYAYGLIDPTPVHLTSFSAARRGRDALLAWQVASEVDHRGFHVWRREGGSSPVRVSEALIAGQSPYAYVDTFAPLGATVYLLQEIAADGAASWVGSTRLEASSLAPEAFLAQNLPNPFNPKTTITFTVPVEQKVDLTIYDIFGRRIVTLMDGVRPAGESRCVWDGRDQYGQPVASGTYLYQLTTDRAIDTRKMTVLR